MNNIERAMVRGLYKEAGVKEILSGLKSSIKSAVASGKQFYNDNKSAINRGLIDIGGAAAGAGISAGINKLRGEKVSILGMLLGGTWGLGAAEAGQWAYRNREALSDKAWALLNRMGIHKDHEKGGLTTTNKLVQRQQDYMDNRKADEYTEYLQNSSGSSNTPEEYTPYRNDYDEGAEAAYIELLDAQQRLEEAQKNYKDKKDYADHFQKNMERWDNHNLNSTPDTDQASRGRPNTFTGYKRS